jgi:thiol-disulfide isomerase/thioredoxin
MKNAFLILLSILVIGTVQAQIPKDAVSLEDTNFDQVYANSRSNPMVKGKINNATKSEINSLKIVYSLVTPFDASQLKKQAKLNADGSFKLELDYPFPYQQIWFSIGENFYTSLTVNKDLTIEIDWKVIKAVKDFNFNGKGLRFLGTDGSLNNYLNNYILYNRDLQIKNSNALSDLLRANPPIQGDIIPAYNLIYESIKQNQEKYIAENPSAFAWILENERMSTYYGELSVRYWNKVMDSSLWQQMKAHKSYIVSNSGVFFYKYLSNYITSLPYNRVKASWQDVVGLPDLNASELAALDSLKKYQYPINTDSLISSDAVVQNERTKIWSDKLKSRISYQLYLKITDRSIQRIDSIFIPAKADFMKLQINNSNDPIVQKMVLEKSIASMHTNWTRTVTLKEYGKTLAKIADINKMMAGSTVLATNTSIGKLVRKTNFGASMYEANNVSVNDFLTSLKQRFKDTAIVLDLWGTWCGACLAEMPHSKKLQLETKGQPVVFVYLCTESGSDKQKWEAKVAELKQPGVHIFIDIALDAEIRNRFSFSGYPGYAFFNRKGEYKPGSFQWLSELDRSKLVDLINQN